MMLPGSAEQHITAEGGRENLRAGEQRIRHESAQSAQKVFVARPWEWSSLQTLGRRMAIYAKRFRNRIGRLALLSIDR
jgi:hypothetical protein